ncbi:MAG: amidohydrolase [Chloroflexi bacterium]|nr:amidohydrolase [Chloroflexota bacterium]
MDSIDIHWHVVPPRILDGLRKDGLGGTAHLERDAAGVEHLMLHAPADVSVEQHAPLPPGVYDDRVMLADMDRMKLDAAAICVMPPTLFYWTEPEVGARISRLSNEGIAEWTRAHPDRFLGLATVPMQDSALAVQELEHAVKILGFRGAEICTNINGLDLDHARFRPVLAAAARLGIPLFLHPQPAGDLRRIQDLFLTNLVGFPAESAIAAARLIFGGVFEELPDLRVILAHGGGYFPYQVGRLDHGWESRPEAKGRIPRKPSEYLANIYCDSLTHSDLSLRFLIDRVGVGHVVLGTDHPFAMGNAAPVDQVRHLGLPFEQERSILSRNLAGLLKLA